VIIANTQNFSKYIEAQHFFTLCLSFFFLIKIKVPGTSQVKYKDILFKENVSQKCNPKYEPQYFTLP